MKLLDQFTDFGSQNFFEPEHADQILACVQGFQEVAGRTKVVTLAEIERESWTLNISRYVLPPIGTDIPPLSVAVAAFRDELARCREAEENLRRMMIEGGWVR